MRFLIQYTCTTLEYITTEIYKFVHQCTYIHGIILRFFIIE